MGKCRVWYHADGKISVSYPDTRARHKPDGITMDEWAIAQFAIIPSKVPRFQGLDYEDIDISQLPQNRKDRNRWRGTKLTGITIDNTIILREDLEKDMDDELAKPAPNPIAIIRLQRKIDKGEHD